MATAAHFLPSAGKTENASTSRGLDAAAMAQVLAELVQPRYFL
jgi:hypothetical protein